MPCPSCHEFRLRPHLSQLVNHFSYFCICEGLECAPLCNATEFAPVVALEYRWSSNCSKDTKESNGNSCSTLRRKRDQHHKLLAMILIHKQPLERAIRKRLEVNQVNLTTRGKAFCKDWLVTSCLCFPRSRDCCGQQGQPSNASISGRGSRIEARFGAGGAFTVRCRRDCTPKFGAKACRGARE